MELDPPLLVRGSSTLYSAHRGCPQAVHCLSTAVSTEYWKQWSALSKYAENGTYSIWTLNLDITWHWQAGVLIFGLPAVQQLHTAAVCKYVCTLFITCRYQGDRPSRCSIPTSTSPCLPPCLLLSPESLLTYYLPASPLFSLESLYVLVPAGPLSYNRIP